MQNSPFISIIIPVRNVRDYVGECLQSCMNQTFENIEIIVADDRGNDESMQIVRDCANKDARIKIISNPVNLGPLHSRLRGSKIARGEYLCYLDGDDFLDARTCELLIAKAKAGGKKENGGEWPDVICFGMQNFPPNPLRHVPIVPKDNLCGENVLKEIFLKPTTPPWQACGKLFKRELVLKAASKLAFVNERLAMAEDALQVFVLALLAKSSRSLKTGLYFYRLNPHSVMNARDRETTEKKIADLKQILFALNKLQNDEELASHPLFFPSKTKFENILLSVIELERRFEPTDGLFPMYLKACLKALKRYKKPATYARIALFTLTSGKIKL